MEETNIRNLFLLLQKQMVSRLITNREVICHPGTKGDASELNWIEWLKRYLPNRYSIDKAFIIDCENHISQQIDVVIYDQQYSPFVFNQDSAIYIPAESVYAVFEVKQELNKDYIIYAGKKAESVRVLKRTSAPIPHAGGRYDPKEPSPIIAGILALSSSWNPALGSSFEESLKALGENQQLNLGCALQNGSFRAVRNETDVQIEKSIAEESLIFFFLKLLMELQSMGTVGALDIASYAQALDSI